MKNRGSIPNKTSNNIHTKLKANQYIGLRLREVKNVTYILDMHFVCLPRSSLTKFDEKGGANLTKVHVRAKFHHNLCSGLRAEVKNVFNEDW